MLAAQIRRVRKLIPALSAGWVREHNLEPGSPPCDWDDPADIDRLVSELIDDANELVWAADELDLDEAQTDAAAPVGAGRRPGRRTRRWPRTVAHRRAHRPGPGDLHRGPRDPTRAQDRHAYRDGYKAHIAAEPDTGLITACALTAGSTGDAEAAPDLLTDEPAGTEVLGDSAYGTGELRQHLQDKAMTAVIKPPPLRPAVEAGYILDDFAIDETAGTVTCPAGITVQITARRNARFGSVPVVSVWAGTRGARTRRTPRDQVEGEEALVAPPRVCGEASISAVTSGCARVLPPRWLRPDGRSDPSSIWTGRISTKRQGSLDADAETYGAPNRSLALPTVPTNGG
jgi:hypothetical protein